jgi:hypothetical protein
MPKNVNSLSPAAQGEILNGIIGCERVAGLALEQKYGGAYIACTDILSHPHH